MRLFAELRAIRSDSPADAQMKSSRHDALAERVVPLMRAADTLCRLTAAGLSSGRLDQDALAASVVGAFDDATSPAEGSRVHWPLAFADIFARENPGFDAVIGNPPFSLPGVGGDSDQPH